MPPAKKTTTKKTASKTATKKTTKATEPASTKKEETIEEIKVIGGQLVDKVKELVKEGNIRRIIIKKEEKVLMEIPLTFAVIGVALAPILAAVGALAALISECTLQIERE